MGVGPHPVLGDAHERLVENSVLGRGLLESQRPVERRACRRPSQQCLRSELGYEHVGGERLVVKLLGEGETRPRHAGRPRRAARISRSSMRQPPRERAREPLGLPPPPPRPEGRARRLRRQLRTSGSWREPSALSLARVREPTGRSPHGPVPLRAASRRTRSAGTPLQLPAAFFLGPIVGRQLSGAIEQERCRPGRPPRSRTTRRLVDDRRNPLVGLRHRGGQLPCPSFRILEQLREPRVRLRAPRGLDCPIRRSGQHRVGETDSVAVDLDDASVERGQQAGVATHAGRQTPSR